jgi:hypothetical protein
MINVSYFPIVGVSIPIIIIFIIIAFFIFIFVFYLLFKDKLKTNVIFDITLILLVCGTIGARFLGIINKLDYYLGLNWGILPIQETPEKLSAAHILPWELLNYNDHNFILWGFVLGILIGGLLIYLFSNKQKNFLTFLDRLIMALIPAQIVLLLGAIASELYYGKTAGILSTYVSSIGQWRTNIALIELLILLTTIILLFILVRLKSQDGVTLAMFLIFQSIVPIFLIPQTENITDQGIPILLIRTVGILLFIIGFYLLFTTLKTPRPVAAPLANSQKDLLPPADIN